MRHATFVARTESRGPDEAHPLPDGKSLFSTPSKPCLFVLQLTAADIATIVDSLEMNAIERLVGT
jgi:hypothetical protein